jgi:hypothetical protein
MLPAGASRCLDSAKNEGTVRGLLSGRRLTRPNLHDVSFDPNSWHWPDKLDGPTAAPESHRVLVDEGDVRVLEVIVRAGHREP